MGVRRREGTGQVDSSESRLVGVQFLHVLLQPSDP